MRVGNGGWRDVRKKTDSFRSAGITVETKSLVNFSVIHNGEREKGPMQRYPEPVADCEDASTKSWSPR